MGVGQYTSRYQGIMGTVVDVTLDAVTGRQAEVAERAVVDEVLRLQGVFDLHRSDSEISRWKQGEADAGPELAQVLNMAVGWMKRSRGALNPAIGAIAELWKDAEAKQRLPDVDALTAAAASIADLATTVLDGRAPTGVREAVDLNAVAKGWIVDRAVDVGLALDGIEGITVNAGGDILHRSARRLLVGIEDPQRPYDNVAPMTRIVLIDAAMATSGGARRFWRIGGRRYGHVLDPRTGRPADHVASASVVAADAATADVLATVLTVLDPREGIEFVDQVGRDVAALVVDADGIRLTNDAWRALEAAVRDR